MLGTLWVILAPCAAVALKTSSTHLLLRGSASVEQSRCRAAPPPEVASLRSLEWPSKKPRAVPNIAKLVYINLAESQDRKTFMEKQFNELKGNGSVFEAQRFPALTTTDVKTDPRFASWRSRGFNPSMEKKSWGTAANMLSHYEAIRQLSGSNLSTGLTMILEDDVVIAPHFQHLWNSLWPYVPDDWDILRVGAFSTGRSCAQKVNEHLDRAEWSDPPPRHPGGESGPCKYCGTQALIVHPASVTRVLRRLEASRFMHTDTAFGANTPPNEDPLTAPPLRVFMLRPFLAQHAEDVLEPSEESGLEPFPSVRDDVDEREADAKVGAPDDDMM